MVMNVAMMMMVMVMVMDDDDDDDDDDDVMVMVMVKMHTFVYSSDFSAAKMMLSIHVIACCFPHADPLKLIPQGEEDM